MKNIFILFLVCIFSSYSLAQTSEESSSSEEERDVRSWPIDPIEYHKLMNDYRVSLGLKPLEYLVPIEKVARYHSQGMASRKRPFGHIGWQFRCQWLNKSLKATNCGEIVAFGQKTPAAVLKAWIESPEHRESLERPGWTHTGLGIARNSYGRIYWTQMFVKLESVVPDADR